jgi:RNA polymerase sigma-70 factor, ECF subfamily
MKVADETVRQDFADIVREHQNLVFSIAWHFLHDRALAEEVAQEVFLQLYRHLDSLGSPAHVLNWLRKVVSNRCIDYARHRKLLPQVDLEDAPEPMAPVVVSGDPMLAKRLRQLVASLPPKQRMVVVLRFQEDLEPEEIARVLNMPIGTVKSQLQRSLELLREKVTRTMGVFSL